MSTTVDDLQAIADRVVAQAGAGEQIEAYVSRGGETAIRIYEGELEHFASAQSEGVGIRVIKNGRTGFAMQERSTLQQLQKCLLMLETT